MNRIAMWVMVGGLAAAGAAQAQQMYNCRTSSGTAYQSERPCAATSGTHAAAAASVNTPARRTNTSSNNVTYYGPSDYSSNSYSYTRPSGNSIGEAPPFIQYMSARCASLNDALRTASARGLKYDVISNMRKDYNNNCSEDEAEARSMMNKAHGDKRQARREEMAATREQQAQAQARETQRVQQCAESKRLLLSKQARTDLNSGEKAELARFEQNFRERCSS